MLIGIMDSGRTVNALVSTKSRLPFPEIISDRVHTPRMLSDVGAIEPLPLSKEPETHTSFLSVTTAVNVSPATHPRQRSSTGTLAVLTPKVTRRCVAASTTHDELKDMDIAGMRYRHV